MSPQREPLENPPFAQAIYKGRRRSNPDFRSVSIYIKKVVSEQVGAGAALSVPVLYGGSVSKDNAMGFLDEGHADGLLIGRESLKLSAMKTIIADAEALGRARVQRSRKHERTR